MFYFCFLAPVARNPSSPLSRDRSKRKAVKSRGTRQSTKQRRVKCADLVDTIVHDAQQHELTITEVSANAVRDVGVGVKVDAQTDVEEEGKVKNSSGNEIELIKNNKGCSKLCFCGYMYTQKHVGKSLITWRCAERGTNKCKASLKTTLAFNDPVLVIEHCHDDNLTRVGATKIRLEMKERAQISHDKPNQIIADVIGKLKSSDAIQINREACRRTLRRTRAKHRPVEPKTLQELTIPDEWTVTAGPTPVQFLIYDNGANADERVMVFSTSEDLTHLAESRTWFMDGTFAVCPNLFTQLYVIHGKVGSSTCPLVYALLQKKTFSTYETLFQLLHNRYLCDPSVVVVDFEKAVHTAVKSVFGEHVEIRGCFYHLTQSTWRKVQSLGLANDYKTNDNIRLFCGQLDALALLPLHDVAKGMSYLKEIAPLETVELLEYFDATYVSGQYHQRPQIGNRLALRLRRKPPLFPPSVWNCHEATLNDEARTNNISEGWNNAIFNLVGHAHPSVFKLIEILKKEQARVHLLLKQDALGMRPKKRVRVVYNELQRRLKNLCLDYQSGHKNIKQFLHGVSGNLRSGQPAI